MHSSNVNRILSFGWSLFSPFLFFSFENFSKFNQMVEPFVSFYIACEWRLSKFALLCRLLCCNAAIHFDQTDFYVTTLNITSMKTKNKTWKRKKTLMNNSSFLPAFDQFMNVFFRLRSFHPFRRITKRNFLLNHPQPPLHFHFRNLFGFGFLSFFRKPLKYLLLSTAQMQYFPVTTLPFRSFFFLSFFLRFVSFPFHLIYSIDTIWLVRSKIILFHLENSNPSMIQHLNCQLFWIQKLVSFFCLRYM